MRPTCKVVARPAPELEQQFIASGRAFARARGYNLVILDGRWDPSAVGAALRTAPVLRLVKQVDGSGGYFAVFYAGGEADSETRVRTDAAQFAAQEIRVAGFNVLPMQSDVTPPLNTLESACVRVTAG